ncbi:MAG: c-type cytochrome [Pseudomonadota bacterium]
MSRPGLLSLTALLLLAACTQEANDSAAAGPSTTVTEASMPDTPPAPGTGELTPLNMEQWARSCALCHVRGEGGAPVLGDAAAWAPRLAQGEEMLLNHTVEGLNNMPPLGYCMDCESGDFVALIRFMGGSR